MEVSKGDEKAVDLTEMNSDTFQFTSGPPVEPEKLASADGIERRFIGID